VDIYAKNNEERAREDPHIFIAILTVLTYAQVGAIIGLRRAPPQCSCLILGVEYLLGDVESY